MESPAGEDAPASEGGRAALVRIAGAVIVAGAALAGGVVYMNREPQGVVDASAARPIPAPAPVEIARSVSGQAAVPTPVPSPLPEAAPAGAPHAPAPEEAPAASIEDVIGRLMPAVVLVETSEGRGSGFFVSPDTLVTNVHVVGRNPSVTVRHIGGGEMRARVDSLAADFDIAVLKVASPQSSQPVIALGSGASARVGQEVIAIGSALGTLQNTVTRGIVSAVRQSGGVILVQTDAAVNPGNSGGPLLDRNGTAIGITTMGYKDRQGLNFAVASDHARAILEGRPPVRAAGAAPSPVPGLSPAVPSEAERTRAEGARAHDEMLARLSQRAAVLDDRWAQFRASCFTTRLAGTHDHEWFALFDGVPRELQSPLAPGCGAWLTEMRQRAAEVRAALVGAEEAARRADVYPGVRRDVRRKHRLDYQGLDR